MNYFCVNRKPQESNGDHEVHNLSKGCQYLPNPINQIDLGFHATCKGAVQEAKRKGYNANGCYYCANECHTS